MTEENHQSSIAAVTGDVIEHESRPPPKKKVTTQAFPEVKKFTTKPVLKEKPPPPPPSIEKEVAEEESMPPPDESLTKNASRYDLSGKNITGMKSSDETYNQGLHNHGDSPDTPGYAIYELATLCRSANISQRAAAFQTLMKIVKNNSESIMSDLKMVQIHKICINAYNPPTSATIQQYAGSIILMLVTHFKEPLSIYPYPAIPMHSLYTNDFAPYLLDLCNIGEFDSRMYDAAATVLVGSEKIPMKFLDKAKLSLPLLHFIRSAFINWGIIIGSNFVDKALKQNKDIEMMKEAAVISRFHSKIPPIDDIKKMPTIVQIILLSRIEDPTPYDWLLKGSIELCPDHFVLEFVTNCALHKMVDENTIREIIKKSKFCQPVVALSEIIHEKPQLPAFPKTEEECWERRDEVVGFVEYVLLHDDFSLLPDLFKCLFTFTNPSADILMEHLFNSRAPPGRPLNPEEVFKIIDNCPAADLPRIFEVGKYFPLHFTGRFFLRKDCFEQAPLFEKFLDTIPDPMTSVHIWECDTEAFLEKFMDGYELPAFQKYALMCVTQGADIEVRHVMWDKLQGIASQFTVDFERKDHYTPYEDDLDTVHDIIDCLSSNEMILKGALKVGYNIVHNLLKHYKGDVRGQLIMEHVLEMPLDWQEEMLKDL